MGLRIGQLLADDMTIVNEDMASVVVEMAIVNKTCNLVLDVLTLLVAVA